VTLGTRWRHLARCGWFWAWALVGAAAALGVVSLGPLLLLPLGLVAIGMASQPRIRNSAFGLLTGAGLLSLFVAYLQRQGPGTTCWHTATASGCDQHLDPRPWLIVGLVLAAAGVVGHAVRSRTT
jgi:hypothetical protein